ncbi:hypothetical protein NDU88_002898 [Pleurodeles waltl]|uniref:Uncharacterized protein n=1 Tax=Pleurodeles waltl TaxID=8319 RepID=A0AAV7NJX5_PLEWA|nr:hypothetical protein NDU88_002898 [Pleurodeles waltl]
MSQSGKPSAVAADKVFEQKRLETCMALQLKMFCRKFKYPFKGLTRKEELQKALRAWLAAKKAGEHKVDEKDVEEEKQSLPLGWLEKPASSVGWGAARMVEQFTPELAAVFLLQGCLQRSWQTGREL